MKKKANLTMKEIRGLILFIAAVCLVVLNAEMVLGFIGLGIGVMQPFIIGGAIAFVLNIPMNLFEKKLFGKAKSDKMKGIGRAASILLSILFVICIVVFVVVTVIPQLGKTLSQLGVQIPIFFQNLMLRLDDIFANNPEIMRQLNSINLESFNWTNIIDSVSGFMKNGISNLLTSTMNVATSIIGAVTNGLIAFIFSIYILSQKETLASQGKRLLKAYSPEKVSTRTLYILHLLHKNFKNFITGQCLEAVILGLMFMIVMSIAQMPYVLLVGVLIGFTALIPLLGAFIGCFVGAFLILVDDPIKAVWFVVIFLVIQQVEGNIIYPRVVGNSVGLPSIWVLAAVSVGGSLFGVPGMLLFIPLFSTMYILIREDVNNREQKVVIEKHEDPKEDPKEDGNVVEETIDT